MRGTRTRRRIIAVAVGATIAVSALAGCSAIDEIAGTGGTPTCSEYQDMTVVERTDAVDAAMAEHGVGPEVDDAMVMFVVDRFCSNADAADVPIDDGVRWDLLTGGTD